MAKALKVGIIGTGGISAVHNSGYVKSGLAEVYALCDIKPDVLKAKSKAYNVPAERCFKNYRDLLKLKPLDAVSVCTPNKLHCPMTVDALKAGKHVLCEKPMAMSPAEAQRMADAAEKSGRKLQIGLMQRFRSDATYVKKLVDSGTLGTIYHARAHAIRRRGVPSWGVFGVLELQGGGPLIDIGVHIIDLTRYLMGSPRPVAVSGKTYQTIGATPGHVGMFGAWDHATYDVEDFAVALVRFENGATMLVESAFCVNLDKDVFGCNVVGDAGGLTLSPLTVHMEVGGHLMDCTPSHVPNINAYHAELQGFIDAIAKHTEVPVPATEAIWTTKIIDAIYASSKSGREVAVK